MGYVFHKEIPENELCAIVNEALWEVFTDAFKEKYRYPPSVPMWTEENVIQWFDRFMNTTEEQDYA
jgi:hypothetical protein